MQDAIFDIQRDNFWIYTTPLWTKYWGLWRVIIADWVLVYNLNLRYVSWRYFSKNIIGKIIIENNGIVRKLLKSVFLKRPAVICKFYCTVVHFVCQEQGTIDNKKYDTDPQI